MALASSLPSDIYEYVMGDDQRSHSAAESQCSVHYNYLILFNPLSDLIEEVSLT